MQHVTIYRAGQVICECAPENEAPLRTLKSVAAISKNSCELIENATTKLTYTMSN